MILCVTGENDGARSAEQKRTIDAFIEQYTDMAVERIDAEEATYDRLYESTSSLPFLVERKLVVLRQPSKNKTFVESFESWLETVPDEIDVLIVEPKLDKRVSYYKQLKKFTDFREFNILDPNSLVSHAVAFAKFLEGSIGTSDARLLVERVGTNQLVVEQELRKLVAYQPAVTATTIKKLTEASPQSSIFDLVRATFEKRGKQAMALYQEQRVLGVEPQQIIAMLAWQLHLLLLCKAAGQRSSEDIARESAQNPFTIKKSYALAQGLSMGELRWAVSELRELDARSKSEGLLPDEAVKYFIVAVSNVQQS